MSYQVLNGDALAMLKALPSESVNCIVTSPPYYGLRDYGHDGQIGLEQTPQEFIGKLVDVFRECRRVLTKDGTCWVNMGDSYATGQSSDTRTPEQRAKLSTLGPKRDGLGGENAGHKAVSFAPRPRVHGLRDKNILGIPWRLAFALQDDGWYLRQDIIWAKPNPMPESVRDRCTKAHEYIFMLTKSAKYWYDAAAIKEHSLDPASYKPRSPRNADKRVGDKFFATKVGDHANGKVYDTRNARTVWAIATNPYPGAHFAVFPPEIPKRCILAGCSENGVVLDPFAGSGTTLAVAVSLGRRAIGIELNPEYVSLIEERMSGVTPSLFTGAWVG